MQVDGSTPLWIAARVLLSARGDDLFRRRDKVLKTLDPEDIHDLRVASRRLREGLALFAPCYPPGKIGRLGKRVKGVTRLLGEMRNTDEAILFFAALADELGDPRRGDLEPLLAALREEREREVGRLTDGLRRSAAGGLRNLFRRVVHAPSLFTPPENGSDPFAPLAAFARETLAARFSALLALLPQARREGEIEAQHRLRIAVKHFRYRLEIFAFLLGAGFPPLHDEVKGYQDVLGKMHDIDVFAGIVRQAGFPPRSEGAVLDAMAAKRGKLFGDFSAMLETMPLETIGERVRNRL